MKRIVVVGGPGSGKTTLADEVSKRLGIPHTELDSLWWGPDWSDAGPELFKERCSTVVAADRWVVDGNYFTFGAREVVWPRADTVIWLDQPRWVTVPRVLGRTLHRLIRGTELWSGNKESWRATLGTKSIVRFAVTEHAKYRERYTHVQRDPELAHLEIVRLRTPREVRAWLSGLG